MGSLTAQESRKVVVVSLEELKQSSVPFDSLEEAFGPSSLGILIVKDLPAKFLELRHKLLSYASYLANLPPEELDTLTCPSANYVSGWSHGKEALKSGSCDTLKGSYYVNCAFYQGKDVTVPPSPEFPEFAAPNVWPSETSLRGFRETFEELCTLIIDTAVLVARACDRYASARIENYQAGYLEHVVKTSMFTKARLLHYFPPEPSSTNGENGNQLEPPAADSSDHDSWCATHIDHGCLTGLTSAIYVDEAKHPPKVPATDPSKPLSTLPALPFLQSPPDPAAGLYIHARDSTITKVSIPPDCLAFQTGEALQLITRGKFRAVPHFVSAGAGGKESMGVARNNLAVFTQPNLEEVVDREKGTTFGEFSREVVSRFG
ncbi:hypothetical protein OEA41_004812 [Lepraria neglecta]|uniref:Clavaminate synthase-like protein n=1 Tax=Lepraria neglecta TaxID=209136 RepID=A0AAD9YYK7_9LECA|nr:hypothetical protein OEA41_004812 [Lepraria neglecta]